jgi:Phosphate-selective porin O and P
MPRVIDVPFLFLLVLVALVGNLRAQAGNEQAGNLPTGRQSSDGAKSRAELQNEIEALKQSQADLEARLGSLEEKEADDLGRITGDDGGALAGWDGQFYIRDKSGDYQLNLGAYTQFRWDMNYRESPPSGENNTVTAFSINRTRIFMTGKFTDQFDFHLRTNIDSQGSVSLVNAWMQWNFEKGWSLRAGEIFLALSREDWMFGLDVLGAEYSPNDYTFGVGTSLGAQAFRQEEDHRYWFAVSNGTTGGKSDITNTNTSDYAFSGRFEWMPVGKDWTVWDDLIGRPGRAQGWMLGMGALFESARAGTVGTPEKGSLITADLSGNGDGWQTLVYASWRYIVPQSGPDFQNYGFLAQASWFFHEKAALYGRYDWISPGNQPGNLENFNSVTMGVNFLPFAFTNKYKLTLETSYVLDSISDTIVPTGAGLGYLPTADDGQFLLRLQMQFGF